MSTCGVCSEDLFMEVEQDSDLEDSASGGPSDPQTVPDDVELKCGCHFHWECLLEAYSVTECPQCGTDVSSRNTSTGKEQVSCIVRNEGGIQEDFDILPLMQEEAYLRTYPEERKAHAFLEFCKDGDIDAIVHMIKDPQEEEQEEEEEELGQGVDVLRYSGSFGAHDGSGLHVAIENDRPEVAWLLLFLGSSASIPDNILVQAKQLGLEESDRSPEPDIRSIKNSEGETAEDLARKTGGQWSGWSTNGLLKAPIPP